MVANSKAATEAAKSEDSDSTESVLERLLKEELAPLGEAGGFVPGGKRLHKSTFYRWWKPGMANPIPDGPRVFLETILIGAIRHTSREAVMRFLQALNATERQQASSNAASIRRRRGQAAKAELAKILG